MRKIIGFIAVLVFVASSVHADGRGFFSLGAALNRSDGLVDVSVPLMPQVSIEGALPIGTGPFSVGYEISALIYRNHTTRWGSETGVGFLVGPAFSLDINERWTLSSGGGIILSNPYSDEASGEFLPGNEGVSAAQFVRLPLQRWYISGAARYQAGGSLALKFGIRNTSPYVSIGWLF